MVKNRKRYLSNLFRDKMKFLIIQENGRHSKNRDFRECFSLQRALIKHGHGCDVWGLGHQNYCSKINFSDYNVIIDLENYDTAGWVPDLSSVNAYKIIWAIDAHVRGMEYYTSKFKKNKCNLILQATRDYLNENSIWFPNCFDDTLIYPKDVVKRADVGFCGNVCNRGIFLDFLRKNFNFISDIFVIGGDMVNAINSYSIHFNKNIANDINYRNFETIGCRVPLITNYHKQYDELGFKNKENCCFYKNLNDLASVVKTLLNNEELKNKIADNGYDLSKKHSYFIRAGQLIDFVEKKI